MKCLICYRRQDAPWVWERFQESPVLLRVLNKPLIEYYLDFCAEAGIRDVRIVSDSPDSRVEDHVQGGSRWGLYVSYGTVHDTDALPQVLRKNRAFHTTGSLLVIEGAPFIAYDQKPLAYGFLKPDTGPQCLTCDSGRLWCMQTDGAVPPALPESVPPAAEGLRVVSLATVQAYYQLCMDLLAQPSHPYTLPGYAQQDRVFWGHHVEVSRYVTVKGPTMIGNEVQLKGRVSLGQNTVIGNHVILDAGTTVQDSIVYGDSYVGQDLELTRKILWRNQVINPDTGESVTLDDDVLVAHLQTTPWPSTASRVVQMCLALGLGLVQALPYVLLFAWVTPAAPGGGFYGKQGQRIPAAQRVGGRSGLSNRLFWGLALDRFPYLRQVLTGRLALVGNRMVPTDRPDQAQLAKLPHYRAGLFSYSEMNGSDRDQMLIEMDELYYCHHAGLRLDLTILFRCLAARLGAAASAAETDNPVAAQPPL